MNTSIVAVALIFGAAFLVMGIEIAHQKRTTGVIDMKAARRWFYRTVGAALILLLGLAIVDLADFGRSRQALSDAEAGSEAAARHDLDMAITLYGKAIEAGTLNDATLGKVYKARGLARLQKHDWDAAEQDLGEAAKHGAGDDAMSHFALGVARSGKGENDAALREFDRTIASVRDPENLRPAALAARGNIYVTLGQPARGLEDYDEALRLTPGDTEILGARGNAYFYLGQYDKAETDLTAAADRDPKMGYYPLWLYLAQRHQGKDGKAELEKRAAKLDLQAWPGPIAEFYRGRSSAGTVLTAAGAGDAKARGDQQCEADFYLGEHALLGGDKEQARRLLGQAADSCDHRFIEYAGAKAELDRLAN